MSKLLPEDRYAPIKLIEKRINKLEMYFRTRWYFDDRFVTIQKAKPRDGCHLVLNGLRGMGQLKLKLTTICRPIDHSDELGGIQKLHSLKMPLSIDKYIKTWNGIDLLVAEVPDPVLRESMIYYINGRKLLDTVKQTRKTDFVRTQNDKYITLANFRLGIALSELESAFGMIEGIDRIDWGRRMITIEMSKLPVARYMKDRKYVQFKSEWKNASPETKALYWDKFTLLPFTDQSRPVIVKSIDTGREMSFDSIKDAVETMSMVVGKELCRGSFDNVLSGRARTIRTPKGKITVRYDLAS
jgi:hypothetical protein